MHITQYTIFQVYHIQWVSLYNFSLDTQEHWSSRAVSYMWRHFLCTSVLRQPCWCTTMYSEKKSLSPFLWSNAGSYLSIISISWTGSYLYYNMQTMDRYLPAFLHSDGESAFCPLNTVHCSTLMWSPWNRCARKLYGMKLLCIECQKCVSANCIAAMQAMFELPR